MDDTGNTYAGLLNGRIKVYIDPYANTDYVTVGYKGTNPYDGGFCPCSIAMVKQVVKITSNHVSGLKLLQNEQTHLLVLHLQQSCRVKTNPATESSRLQTS